MKVGRRGPQPGTASKPRPGLPPREQDLALLLLVSDELSRSLDVDDVLSTISRRLLDVVPAWRVGVLLIEDERRLRLAAGSERDRPAEAFPRGRLLERGDYPEVERAITTRRVVEVADLATDPLMASVRGPLVERGLRSLLLLPMVAQGAPLGALSLAQRAGERPFTARERSLLQAVANQAAVALRNAQLFGQLQAGARELEAKVEERTQRLAQSHARLAVLTDITAAMNLGFDLDRILTAALAGLSRLAGVRRARVMLQGQGAGAAEVHELGAGGRLITTHEARPDSLAAPDAGLVAPLVSKDAVIGSVQVTLEPGAGPQVDLELLQQVAGELSIALERVELYRAEQRRSRQLEVLSDVGRRVTQAVAVENLLQVAADLIRVAFDYSLVSILRVETDPPGLGVAGVSSADPSVARAVRDHRQQRDQGLCGAALQSGRSINVPDVRQEPRFLPAGELETLSEVVVPIMGASGPVGVIDVQDDSAGAFTSADVALLESLADQLATAMRLAGLFEDLQRGRTFTEQVINNLTAGLVVTDSSRVVQVVNQRAGEILRERPEALVGKDLLAVFPTAAPLFQFSYETAGRECEVQLRDGRRIPLGFSNSFFVEAGAGRDAVIITFRDLSEVQELQRKVRQAERLATIGTVAAGVAHEIRNPLFGISATAQILEREIPEGSPLRALCKGMLDETRRVNDLVTNLVAFGRPHEPKLRPVEPARLLEEAAASVAARGREAGCQVLIENGPAEPGRTIEADPDQIKQVLINLLLNAFDAAPGGRVRTGVAWEEPQGMARLFVRDDGPGIPPDQVEQVFELFFTTKTRGSGMGLALSARIVQEHDGTITAANAEGGGALFEVRLPPRRVERRGSPGAP